jgi:hypothetical protein
LEIVLCRPPIVQIADVINLGRVFLDIVEINVLFTVDTGSWDAAQSYENENVQHHRAKTQREISKLTEYQAWFLSEAHVDWAPWDGVHLASVPIYCKLTE